MKLFARGSRNRLSLLCLFICLSSVPGLSAQNKIQVVSSDLSQELIKLFPEINQGYIDLNGNGKADELADLSEVIPESRVKDGQLQAQEILDFIIENWRSISLDKLKAVQKAVKAQTGALGGLIAIDYAASIDDAVKQREAMGNHLYLTPSAYKEAMTKMEELISGMAAAYKKEGQKSESDFVTSRDALLDMIQKGYPLPEDIPQEEKATLSTSMTSIVLSAGTAKGKDQDKVKAAIETLGGLKSAESGPYLIALLGKAEYQIEAMDALGLIRYRPAVPQLSDMLKSSSDLNIKLAALRAVGQIGGAEGLEAVLGLVKKPDRDSLEPELLVAAAEALAGIAKSGNTDVKILASLKDLAAHDNPDVRKAAVSGLGAFNAAQSSETLLAALANDKDPEVREAAVNEVNSQRNDAVAVPALIKVLREKELDPKLAVSVINALGKNAQGSQALSLIVDRLQDKDENVRAAASTALMSLYPNNAPLVTASLTRPLLASQDPAFLIAGTSLLADFADVSTVPSLLTLLASPNSEVKRNVTWAFYRIHSSANPRVVDELQKLITNENESIEVRVNAVRAVGAIGYDTAQLNIWQTLGTTAQMRGDKYASLRFYAVRALGGFLPAKPQTLQALARIAAKDADVELRKEALRSLVKLAVNDGDVEALIAGSFNSTEDPEVRTLIIETLADMGSERTAALGADFIAGEASVSLKRRVLAALSETPGTASAEVLLDACRTAGLSDYAEGLLEGYPASFMGSLISRRMRSESDKNVISVLEALETRFGN